MPRILAFVCALGLVVATLQGCGPGGPKLVPVSGKVTLDGKALANKSVNFKPEPGTEGSGAGGTSDAEGNYTLTAVVPGATKSYPGIAPGTYRVTITEPMVSATSGTATGGGESAEIFATGGPAKPSFPPIYSSASSPLKLTVPEAGGTLAIELKSKP